MAYWKLPFHVTTFVAARNEFIHIISLPYTSGRVWVDTLAPPGAPLKCVSTERGYCGAATKV
jgi:hypothetical protein